MKRVWTLLTLLALTACGKESSKAPTRCASAPDCSALGSSYECDNGRCVETGDAGSNAAGAGGEEGSNTEEQCSTNTDCIDAHSGNPWLCRAQHCVRLTEASQCPLVIGAGDGLGVLRERDPIVLGAYVPMDLQLPRDSAAVSIELALDEVNRAIAESSLGRPYVAVVCQALRPTLSTSLEHLLNDVGVSAILAALDSRNLSAAFEQSRRQADVFFLSPLGADPALTVLDDDGLLWHMQGLAEELSPAYVPLMERTESLVRTRLEEVGSDPEVPLRVALVETDTPFLNPLTEQVFATVRFNGASVSSNEADGNFLRLRMASELQTAFPDAEAVIDALAAFAPHVIVSMAGEEFTRDVMAPLDWNWESLSGSSFEPFFLLAPTNFGNQAILDSAGVVSGPLVKRLLGVYYASPEDSTLRDAFFARLSKTHDPRGPLVATANYYDAAYFLMYALFATGSVEPTGREVADAMERLVSGSRRFDVGPEQVTDVLDALAARDDAELALHGTLGPPDFSSSSGTRPATPNIYCLDRPGARDAGFVPDVLRYDPDSETLEGDPVCVPGF